MSKATMRWYAVRFVTLDRNPTERTVKVQSTDSVHASMLVYQQFGRKKIKVKSAKPIKEDKDEIQKETGGN